MKGYTRLAMGILSGAALILAQNLLGRQLNALFLRLPGIDKVLHVSAYFVLFVWIYWLAGGVTRHAHRRALLAGGAGLLLSAMDELVQSVVPGRTVESMDLAADWAGLTLGWIAVVQPSWRVAMAAAAPALALAAYATYATHAKLIDYSRALRYERSHDFVRAREHYLRAVAAGWRTSTVYNGLAWVTVESGGDATEAVAYARTALELQPDSADILDTYGWALHRAGRSREALLPLQQAYAKNPNIFCIHYHLGEVYLALSQTEVAQAHLRKQMEYPETREAALAARALAGTTGSSGSAVDGNRK